MTVDIENAMKIYHAVPTGITEIKLTVTIRHVKPTVFDVKIQCCKYRRQFDTAAEYCGWINEEKAFSHISA